MVKTLRIPLDDITHETWSRIKGETTWEDVLRRGIQSIEGWPGDAEWNKNLLDKEDMKNE